ncbi:MAG: Lpg1974 family pore-forming outer membrane protein [Chlamydiae bacterium]|nr:Lpg1974 family pore-forming outer membrane protein [Chlamydiota bacterium]
MQTRSSLFAASLLCASTALHADSQTIQIPEGKLTSHPSLFGDITPSAGPRVIDGYGVYLTGDYLYWTAREDDLDFAASGASTTTALPTERGKKFAPGYRFQSGFRGGIGFDFGHDKWDLYMDYTWFNTNSNTKSASSDGSQPLTNLIPMGGADSFSQLNSAKGIWDLRFNVIDIELGRNFYISKFLSLRPFFGSKGTWQKQIYNVHYDFATDPNIASNNKNTYWAIGLLTGINTTWHLPGTWSMFADLGLSTLWGAFKVKRTDKDDTGLTHYETKDGFHTIKPVIELGAGIRKEEWFYDDRFHFSMQAGWEQQIWFSQNQFDFFTSPRQGDMNIQGFTAKVRFDF